MPEQELNLAAAKFISSLTKSLQILCNGQVDFTESIELVGHINVKVDHRFKFDYIVDEQVSKEEDSSTTFLSNSYHSHPPSKQTSKKLSPSELDQQDIFSDIPETFQRKTKQSKSTSEILDQHNVHAEDTSSVRDESSHNYSVSVECQGKQPMVVKLEEGEDSNDCMVLPVSPGNYSVPGDGGGTEAFPIAGPSGSFEDSEGGLSNLPRKRRKVNEKGADNTDEGKVRQTNHSAESNFGGSIQCPTCRQQFSNMDNLVAHQYVCPYSSSQSQQQYYQPSFTSVHPTQTPLSEDMVNCTMCGEVFDSPRKRLEHMNRNHGISIYPCHSCSEIFGSPRSLYDHKKTIHGYSTPHLACPQCDKTFTTTVNLRGHMNTHRGLQPFKCYKCGKAFAYSQSKNRHQKFCNKISVPFVS